MYIPYIYNIHNQKPSIGILKACEPSISRALAFKRQHSIPRNARIKVFAGAPHARVLARAGIPADT